MTNSPKTDIPTCISNQIGNVNMVRVDIGNTKGRTHYIDFITKNHFPKGYSIIYGYDIYGRFFISALYTESPENQTNQENQESVMTLFQRYTDNANFFVTCGNTFFIGSDVRTWHTNNTNNMDVQINNFFKMIRTGKTTYDNKRITQQGYETITRTFTLF